MLYTPIISTCNINSKYQRQNYMKKLNTCMKAKLVSIKTVSFDF